MAAQRKSTRYSKKEPADLRQKIEELAQRIADKKERTQFVQVELERYTLKARHSHERLQALKVGALGVIDANERSKINAEIRDIERESSDILFKLATKRSDARRNARMIKECEEMLLAVREDMKKAREVS